MNKLGLIETGSTLLANPLELQVIVPKPEILGHRAEPGLRILVTAVKLLAFNAPVAKAFARPNANVLFGT